MFGFERMATVARQLEHAAQLGASNVQEFADGLATAIEVSRLEMHGRVPANAVTPTRESGDAEGEFADVTAT